jgi:hypothetical protein
MKFRWPWSKRPPALAIPPYVAPVIEPKAPAEPSVIVEEHDTSEMTRTGIHRAWDRLSGKFRE